MAARPELPVELFSAAQTRELDAAIIRSGVPGLELMHRAAEATWQAIVARWPDSRELTVLCGGGNNGGDGYLVGLLASQAGWQVSILALAEPAGLKGDAAKAARLAQEAGIDVRPWRADAPLAGVVVDAMLGTGLAGQVRQPYADAIERVNGAVRPVVSVDIPSGLHADRGVVLGAAVKATLTVSFIALKPGLFTAQGPDQVGALEFAALAARPPGAPQPVAERLDFRRWRQTLAPRAKGSHKGSFGHLVLIGGDHGMGGAIVLAAETALRSGAGKVTVLTRAEHLLPLLARCPEIMVRAVDRPGEAEPVLAQASSLVVGPGLGRAEWGRGLLEAALATGLPCVLDADALNMLAASAQPKALGEHCLITPHPAEAARLLGSETAQIQQDRLAACRELVRRYACTAVLKGAGSLVASPAAPEPSLALCSHGNPGMATAGMGDVLSGLAGALLAQGLSAPVAARYAVLVHALAGDCAAQAGQRGLLASDLIAPIRTLLNRGAGDA